MSSPLAEGTRILLVEDEPFVAIELEYGFQERGCIVTTATSSSEAMDALQEGGIDAAVVDVLLEGTLCTPVIDKLRERNIPMVVVSGAARLVSGVRWVMKPVLFEDVIDALGDAFAPTRG